MSNGNRHQPKTAEHRGAISEGCKGKKKSKQHRARIAAALKGLKRSEATRRKMSKSVKARWKQHHAYIAELEARVKERDPTWQPKASAKWRA